MSGSDMNSDVDYALSTRRLRILTTHNEELIKEMQYLCLNVPELENQYKSFMKEFNSLIDSEAEYRSKFKDKNVG